MIEKKHPPKNREQFFTFFILEFSHLASSNRTTCIFSFFFLGVYALINSIHIDFNSKKRITHTHRDKEIWPGSTGVTLYSAIKTYQGERIAIWYASDIVQRNSPAHH